MKPRKAVALMVAFMFASMACVDYYRNYHTHEGKIAGMLLDFSLASRRAHFHDFWTSPLKPSLSWLVFGRAKATVLAKWDEPPRIFVSCKETQAPCNVEPLKDWLLKVAERMPIGVIFVDHQNEANFIVAPEDTKLSQEWEPISSVHAEDDCFASYVYADINKRLVFVSVAAAPRDVNISMESCLYHAFGINHLPYEKVFLYLVSVLYDPRLKSGMGRRDIVDGLRWK